MRLFANRVYKSGTGIQWCFWRWSDAQEPYLTRLFVFKTPWFALCWNHIKQEDVGDPHDHTSAFLSIPLWGWYREQRLIGGSEFLAVRSILNWNYVRGCNWDAHRILEVSKGGMYSLCIMGPKVREWYYHTPEGLVHWAAYKGAA